MATNGMVSACSESAKAQVASTGVGYFDPSWASITSILLHFNLPGRGDSRDSTDREKAADEKTSPNR